MTAWARICFSMFASQVFGLKALMPGGWKAKDLSSDLLASFQASKLYSLLVYPNNSLNLASSITATPSSLALVSFEPGDSPATT